MVTTATPDHQDPNASMDTKVASIEQSALGQSEPLEAQAVSISPTAGEKQNANEIALNRNEPTLSPENTKEDALEKKEDTPDKKKDWGIHNLKTLVISTLAFLITKALIALFNKIKEAREKSSTKGITGDVSVDIEPQNHKGMSKASTADKKRGSIEIESNANATAYNEQEQDRHGQATNNPTLTDTSHLDGTEQKPNNKPESPSQFNGTENIYLATIMNARAMAVELEQNGQTQSAANLVTTAAQRTPETGHQNKNNRTSALQEEKNQNIKRHSKQHSRALRRTSSHF